MRLLTQVGRGHHPVQGQLERTGRIGKEVRHTAQRLVLACIEHIDRKNKLCNLKIKPVMVLCAFSHGFQAPQLRRFLFAEREGMKVVGWLL